MAEGSDGYKGLAVPLFGDFEIKQRTAATDMMTLTGITGQTGDFIVCQDLDGNENFVVGEEGQLTVASLATINSLTVTAAASVGGAATLTGGVANECEFSAGLDIPSGQYIRFSTPVTTAPTTALTKGDIFLAMSTSTPQIGICFSTAANSLRYVTADTKTLGRTTSS